MNELHTLIATLEAQAQVLREHAAKDVARVRAEVIRAEQVVRDEITALVDRLRQL
jgi:hypothetical protein